MAFLHGVETFTDANPAAGIAEVITAVIGIVGTAPIHLVAEADRTINQAIVCSNAKDDARYFGPDTAGYTLPKALARLRKLGAGRIVVVNVFDPDTRVDLTPEPDPSAVTTAEIVGTTDAGGNRTGMQAWLDNKTKVGYYPKILIAPGFHSVTTVAAELRVLSGKMLAVNGIDAAVGTTYAQALANRAVVGNAFMTSDERSMLLYPHVKVYDPVTDGSILEGLSIWWAGALAAKDRKAGYWHSPSNTSLEGIDGLEFMLTAALNDPDCEVNQLNAAGITTLFNSYGTGLRLWGNRSAAFPTETRSFLHSVRVADVIQESIEQFMLKHMDKPLNGAILDEVTENVNSFLNTLQGRGAIIGGKAWLSVENTKDSLAGGQGIWEYDWVDPPSLERVTFKRRVNLDYLNSLLPGGAA